MQSWGFRSEQAVEAVRGPKALCIRWAASIIPQWSGCFGVKDTDLPGRKGPRPADDQVLVLADRRY